MFIRITHNGVPYRSISKKMSASETRELARSHIDELRDNTLDFFLESSNGYIIFTSGVLKKSVIEYVVEYDDIQQ